MKRTRLYRKIRLQFAFALVSVVVALRFAAFCFRNGGVPLGIAVVVLAALLIIYTSRVLVASVQGELTSEKIATISADAATLEFEVPPGYSRVWLDLLGDNPGHVEVKCVGKGLVAAPLPHLRLRRANRTFVFQVRSENASIEPARLDFSPAKPPKRPAPTFRVQVTVQSLASVTAPRVAKPVAK